MGKKRRTGASALDRRVSDEADVSRLPVQRVIEKLQMSLAAFNDRISELQKENHQGHATKVLKAYAMDLARQIEELRCLSIEPKP